MARQVKAVIDLGALQSNYRLAKAHAGSAKIVTVIKADGYGHGAIGVAGALADADMFAVASLEEAQELRRAGIDKPLLLLSGFHQERDLTEISALKLDTVIHCETQLESLLGASLNTPLRVWLKVDSGMHRLGIAPQTLPDTFNRLKRSRNVADVYLMSHFATADDPANPFTLAQLEAFDRCTGGLQAQASLCNSAALINLPEARREWVRPGIMLYGANPFVINHPIAAELKPVMTLESQILAIRDVAAGESVGYGRRFVAQRDSRIGTVAIGYGDGYPRHAPHGTPVLIRGKYAPLAGTVSMDLIGVDLTDIPEAAIGDRAILWGEGLPVDTIAEKAGTISYELLTGVNKRVPRHYRPPARSAVDNSP